MFQQEWECLFSNSSSKQRLSPKHEGDIDTDRDVRDNNADDHCLQTIGMRSWTLERRRCAWIYLLQRRQHQSSQQQQQENKKTSSRENKGFVDRLQHWISELLDTEYCNNHLQQQHDDNTKKYDKTPLESILQRFETEEERRMTFQAVLVVKEYFSQLYQCLEKDDQSSATTQVEMQKSQGIPRLLPLLVQLVRSAGNRRTRLAQTAWTTAILLVALRIRRYSSFVTTMSSSSSLSRDLSANCCSLEQLQLLLQQQLIWQQSKKKKTSSALEKIIRLQGLQQSSVNIASIIDTEPGELNPSSLSLLLTDVVTDLDTLI